MGARTFDGVRFHAFTDDHDPPHVHASYAGNRVIVDLMIEERKISLSFRETSVQPRNAKRSNINHVLKTAKKNFDELVALWRDAR